MQLAPVSVLEAWPKPNYINPVIRGHGNVILNIVLYSLVFFFISIRMFTRVHLKKIFGADDFFILLAMVSSNSTCKTSSEVVNLRGLIFIS